MNKYFKRLFFSVIFINIVFFVGCFNGGSSDVINNSKNTDIVILYTNDVHCAIDDNTGYAGLAAYKKAMEAQHKYVTLVDNGDAINGKFIGSTSKGSSIRDIMNKVGYDLAIMGNHEFDFGIPNLSQNIIGQAKTKYLNCNICYTGKSNNPLCETASYTILNYGAVRVGFIGVTTPDIYVSTSKKEDFYENNELVYDVRMGNKGKDLYEAVQVSVDDCRKQGASFVVLMAHLGDTEDTVPYSSIEVINNTSGIDVVLDGHSHSTIECQRVPNKNNKEVILSSTGTELKNIGKLTISGNSLTTELINDYEAKDPDVALYVLQIQEQFLSELNKPIGEISQTLSCYENGNPDNRLVRNREANIGNWVTDAICYACKEADIAIINGGGVRNDVKKGVVKKLDFENLNTYDNKAIVCEATGQQIADILEWGSKETKKEYKNKEGEFGCFLQVSNLKYEIDTSVPSHVVLDEDGLFTNKVDGERRVKNIMIYNKSTKSYEPINLEKKYKVVSSDYVLLQKGDGQAVFNGCAGIKFIDNLTDVYLKYFYYLNGNFDAYAELQGRIIVH